MASASHRDHFRVIAAAEELSTSERIEDALRRAPGERILAGLEMGALVPWSAELLAQIDADSDGQMGIARRWIALGRPRAGG